MPALRRDYKVLFRREESIEQIALKCRRFAGIENDGYFNIVVFVEEALRLILERLNKGVLNICFFDAGPDDDPAYVEFVPRMTLSVDKEIWQLARMGDPLARFIAAHEIGHLVLHDHDAKAFSNDPASQISFESMNEYSAEWQANTFAPYFLLPTHIVESIGDARRLAQLCSVSLKLATDRLSQVRKRCGSAKYSGEACANCGSFTLSPIGVKWICHTCQFARLIYEPRQQ